MVLPDKGKHPVNAGFSTKRHNPAITSFFTYETAKPYYPLPFSRFKGIFLVLTNIYSMI